MWIKVEDKMPKKFENVLCLFPEKDYGSKIEVSYNEGNEYFADQFKWGKVTHWQPLPELPTEMFVVQYNRREPKFR